MKFRSKSLLQTWIFRIGLVLSIFLIWIFFVVEQPGGDATRRIKTTQIVSLNSQVEGTSSPTDHLIIVPGHSVINIDAFGSGREDSDRAWKLLDYQEKQGLPKIIASHIETAINISKSDVKSMLLFSGGQTRVDAGPISEGLSYYMYSKIMGWLEDDLLDRVNVEEYATDSFENLIFSVCRFKELAGVYPSRITIVGFDFKKKRYETLHRAAIGFPESAFRYIGIKPDSAAFDHDLAESGESKTYSSFQSKMYGCDPAEGHNIGSQPSLRGGPRPHKANTEPSSSEIVAKRFARNPFKRSVPYEVSCSELAPLLHWCGPGLFRDYDRNSHRLPWA